MSAHPSKLSAAVLSIPQPLELSLLNGFAFTCRPDCSLCCFASPSISPQEHRDLLQIRPAGSFLEDEGGQATNVRSRPQGGACTYLHHRRCGVYSARPFPCREYPLSVHIGSRPQATLVLACPGISLAPLSQWSHGGPPSAPPQGLDSEIERVLAEAVRQPLDQWLKEGHRIEDRTRSRLLRAHRWDAAEDLRARVISDLPWPSEEDFPAEDPPDTSEGWDALPLYFDEEHGPVTFLSRTEGWEAFSMREEGGPRHSLGLIPPLGAMPHLTEDARELLRGYLVYNLHRDFLFWLAYRELEAQEEATLEEMVREILRELAVQAMARSAFRAALQGSPWQTLRPRDIEQGIRAIDNDFLDQATLGGIL